MPSTRPTIPARRRRTCSPARWSSPRRAGRSTCATSASGGAGRRARAGSTRRAPAARRRRPDHPVVHVAHEDAAAYAAWAGAAPADRGRVGVRRPRRSRGRDVHLGRRGAARGPDHGQHLGRARLPVAQHRRERLSADRARGQLPGQRVRPFDMAGNVWEWTDDWWTSRHPDDAGSPCCAPDEPAGRRPRAELRPGPAAVPGRAQGDQGRLPPVRRHLLPALPARRPPTTDDRHRHEPRRLPVRTPDSRRDPGGDLSAGPTSCRRGGPDPPATPLLGSSTRRRGAAERAGRLLRQRRHPVVRAARPTSSSTSSSTPSRRGGRGPGFARDAGVRRPARPATPAAMGELGLERIAMALTACSRASPPEAFTAPGARVHGERHAPRRSAVRCGARLPADARADRRAPPAGLHGLHRHRWRHRVRAGGQPGPVRRAPRGRRRHADRLRLSAAATTTRPVLRRSIACGRCQRGRRQGEQHPDPARSPTHPRGGELRGRPRDAGVGRGRRRTEAGAARRPRRRRPRVPLRERGRDLRRSGADHRRRSRLGWTVVSMANDWTTVFGNDAHGQGRPSPDG